MKVVIAGQGKSGTTALYTRILNSMNPQVTTLFEPSRFTPTSDSNVLAKVLIDPPGRVDFESFAQFDKKVLIVRDPRDNLVSRVLYRAFNRIEFVSSPPLVNAFLDILREKESYPGSCSLLSIIRRFDSLNGINTLPALSAHVTTGMSFHREHPEYFVFKYENMIDESFLDLSEYLEFPISEKPVQVDSIYQRVTRSKSYGDWRNWFTEADVEYFTEVYSEFLQLFGYKNDWHISKAPIIDPAQSSHYVLNIVNDRRERLGLESLSGS